MDFTLIIIAVLVILGLNYVCFTTLGLLKKKLNQEAAVSNPLLRDIFNSRLGLILLIPATLVVVLITCRQMFSDQSRQITALQEKIRASYDTSANWTAPDPSFILQSPHKDLILYGRQLIANTADFLGPQGVIKPMSNGMNCQNCHLDAGTKAFGNNYSAVLANYPKFRARSGTEETISKRINDCFQRSLNGDSLKLNSKEMKAMVAYIHWLGQAVPKNFTPRGSGLLRLKPLNRPANPEEGHRIYMLKCQSCHGYDGTGLARPDLPGQKYPPLWGINSYNEAAGLFRLSAFAGYVKANMPFGVTAETPELSDEEAWDLAAFVNSKPRPRHKFLNIDWPVMSKKPYDHPFGPFADSFSVAQHKYGPFQPIIQFQSSQAK